MTFVELLKSKIKPINGNTVTRLQPYHSVDRWMTILPHLSGRELSTGEEWLAIADVYDSLNVTGHQRYSYSQKISKLMRSLGWKPARFGSGTKRARGYVKPIKR